MFIVRFTSGLGNQMFQYCFTLLLKKLYPSVPVKADLTWFYANNDHHGYELYRIFKGSLSLEEASYKEIFKATGLLPNTRMPSDMVSFKNEREYRGSSDVSAAKRYERFLRYPNRIIREFTEKKRESRIFDELSGRTFDINTLDPLKDYYFKGFFTEERFFSEVLDEAGKDFIFPEFEDPINLKLKEMIEKENSVSIHVRRGDYLTTYASMFRSLGRDYYEGAVKLISGLTGIDIKELKFYIFSDDPGFVKDEFVFIDNKVIVTNNTGNDSFRDMQLMSLCAHNIIANSTFSQWAAFLNKNEGRYVIYPRAYLKDQDNEEKHLKGFIML